MEEIKVDPNAPSVSIKDTDSTEEVLRVEKDGRIFWKRVGEKELKAVTCDEEIAQAFSYCVTVMCSLDPEALIEEIVKQNISLVIPKNILGKIDEEAKESERSRNAMVVFILKEYFK